MVHRRKCGLEKTPIEGCMSGKGIIWMEKLFLGSEEIRGKERAYVHHTLNRGVSIGTHTHEDEMETMVIVKGKALHTINERERYLEEGDVIVTQSGDIRGISQAEEGPLVLIVQVLSAQTARHKKLQKRRLDK